MFTILFLRFLLSFSLFLLRRYIKQSRQCLIMTTFSNTAMVRRSKTFCRIFNFVFGVSKFGQIRSFVLHLLLVRMPRLKFAKFWEHFKKKKTGSWDLKRTHLCVLKISKYKCNTETCLQLNDIKFFLSVNDKTSQKKSSALAVC